MTRTSWQHLAFSSVLRALRRTMCPSRFERRTAIRLRQRAWAPTFALAAEVLEVRQLLSSYAVDDSYSVAHDHTLTENAANGVLANDHSFGGSMSAVLVAGPSHGTLTLNSDGSFTFVTAGYAGSDSFTYHNWDGTSYSNTATVSIGIIDHPPSVGGVSYTIYKDSFNSASEGAPTLLSNSSDLDGDALTASLVTGPSHGSVTVNSNGSFLYTPVAGYYGSDSFVFGVSDGAETTNGTASLTVTSAFGAQSNTPDDPFTGNIDQGPFATNQLTGSAIVSYGLGQNHTLVYSSVTADVKPIIMVDTTVGTGGASGVPVPSSIEMHLTFGGLTGSTLYFNNSLSSGSTVQFAEQIDASSLATGHYQYQVTLIAHYGSTTSTRVFTGYQDIVNRQSGPFGPGWNVGELDSLAIGTGGVLYVTGTGSTAWFTDTGGGTYSSPAGPMAFSTLVKNVGGDFTLTDKYGNTENFSSAGLLTSSVDTNGNTTSYAYTSGKLTSITDPFSRVTYFNYTGGLVTSITDIGSQTTTLAYTSGLLTSITAPDPDGAGPLSAPVTAYAYTSNRITSITDPQSHVTTLSFNFAGRLSGATFADSSTASFTPTEMAGLFDTSGGLGLSSSNPATPYVLSTVWATYVDPLSDQTTTTFDQWGNVLSFKDPLNNATTYVRNSNGLVTQMTAPDPDGSGPLTAPVTTYTYDSAGNVTKITYADSSYETWTYGTSGGSLNRPLTHVDQLGHTTSYTYDSHGNLLTVTDRLGNVTTYAYNSRGELTSITGADPDGTGPLTAPVTTYTLDSYGRVTRITNADSTHKDFTYDSENNLLTSTDELGRTTTYVYDSLSRLSSVTLPDPDGTGPLTAPVTTYAYNADGLRTSETDALGNTTQYGYNARNWLTSVTLPNPTTGAAGGGPVTTYGYDADGRQTTVTDALGNVTTTAYDADGHVASVTQPDPDGAGPLSAPVTSYTYDNLGRVTKATDPNNGSTLYAYNSINQLTSKTDALGNVTSYTYDELGDVLTVTAPDPDGAGPLTSPVTTMTYDAEQHLLTTTDPLSNVTTDAYDHLGRLTSVTQPNPSTGGGTGGPVTAYAYDSMDRKVSVTNALGNTTEYGYDNAGELTSVTLPNATTGTAGGGPVTSYQYDNDGHLTLVTDPLLRTTGSSYDADGNILTTTDSLGNVTTNAYDHDGRLTSVTSPDPDGAGPLTAEVTSYAYNADGQVTSQTNAASGVTSNSYDNDGRLISQTDPASRTTQYAYDSNGNLTKQTDNLGNATQYAYNADNWRTSSTAPDPDGAGPLTAAVTSTGYDNLGRAITSTDANGHVTSFAYDADGNLTSVKDPDNNTTTFAFDHLNRETSTTDANSHTASFTYDALGEMTSKTDKDSRTTNFTFDHIGQLTQEQWMSGGSAIYTATYAYDAAGNQTSASDNFSDYAYSYNANNLVTSVDNSGTPSVPHVVLSLGYDNLGRETSLSATVAGTADFLNNYSYDSVDRLTEITQQQQTGGNSVAAKRVDLTYNADSQFSTITRYANLAGTQLVATSTYGYNGDGQITSLAHTQGATTLNSFAYGYDNASRLTSASSNDGTDTFTYDSAGQITASTHSYQTNESYSYDANGNRTNTGYSTGTNNQLSSDGTFNYTYDNAGNMTRKTAVSGGAYTTYTWDYHNRLTDVSTYTSGGTLTSHVHYVYDVFDRLIGKQVDPTGGGTYTSSEWYVLSPPSQGGAGGVGSSILLAFNSSGAMTDRMLVLPPSGGSPADQTLADENSSGTVSWLLPDYQGTIRDVAQFNSGTGVTSVVNHLKFDSFGNITAQSNSAFQPLFAFQGMMLIPEAGLYYDHARWYDSHTGRFISQDPKGFGARDPDLYRFVGNSPADLTDPSGTEWQHWTPNALGTGIDGTKSKYIKDGQPKVGKVLVYNFTLGVTAYKYPDGTIAYVFKRMVKENNNTRYVFYVGILVPNADRAILVGTNTLPRDIDLKPPTVRVLKPGEEKKEGAVVITWKPANKDDPDGRPDGAEVEVEVEIEGFPGGGYVVNKTKYGPGPGEYEVIPGIGWKFGNNPNKDYPPPPPAPGPVYYPPIPDDPNKPKNP